MCLAAFSKSSALARSRAEKRLMRFSKRLLPMSKAKYNCITERFFLFHALRQDKRQEDLFAVKKFRGRKGIALQQHFWVAAHGRSHNLLVVEMLLGDAKRSGIAVVENSTCSAG